MNDRGRINELEDLSIEFTLSEQQRESIIDWGKK